MSPPDPTPQLSRFKTYDEAVSAFHWQIPERFNIAGEILTRHPDAVTRLALQDVKFAGVNSYTFGGLDFLSDKFAVVLTEQGIRQGDRVGIALPQSAAAAVAELGVLKTGAIALIIPSSHHSFEDILVSARVKALVVDEAINERTPSSVNPAGTPVFVVGQNVSPGNFKDFWKEIDLSASDFDPVQVDAAAHAFIFPELGHRESNSIGIVHSHASAIGCLPAFEMANGLELGDQDVFWTSIGWSTPSALLGILIPAWWYGCSVVALDRGLPSGWINALDSCSVTHAVLSDMHLRFLLGAEPMLSRELMQPLRRIICDTPPASEQQKACEDLGEELGVLQGWPEAPAIVATCNEWFPTAVGWSGRVAPGHTLRVLDKRGDVVQAGTLGRIFAQVPPPLRPSVLRKDGEIEPLEVDRIDVGSLGMVDDHSRVWLSTDRLARSS
jgi:acetyl-CoA synthetase